MKLLTNHRSIRNYQSKEVEADIIKEILESGIRASNTGNMQFYSVIVTRMLKKENNLLLFTLTSQW